MAKSAKSSKASKSKASSKTKKVSTPARLQQNVSPQTFGLTLFALFFSMIGLVYVVATKAASL